MLCGIAILLYALFYAYINRDLAKGGCNYSDKNIQNKVRHGVIIAACRQHV